jgi:hypothetical protein
MGRKTIGGAVLALLLLGLFVGGYVLYSHSEAYQIGVARGHGDVSDRKAAMSDLLNRRDPEGVAPVFIALLGDRDAIIRAEAAEDLGFMRARGAVEALIVALAKQDPSGRSAFVEALGAIGDPRALAPLAALFDAAGQGEARATSRVRLRSSAHRRFRPSSSTSMIRSRPGERPRRPGSAGSRSQPTTI